MVENALRFSIRELKEQPRDLRPSLTFGEWLPDRPRCDLADRKASGLSKTAATASVLSHALIPYAPLAALGPA